MKKIKIKLNEISKSFEKNDGSKKIVLEECNLEIFNGKIHVILGGSGSGKSVLLKILLGLIEADSGEIFVDGAKISPKNIDSILLSKSGVLFQNNALFDSKNVYENIIFPFLGLRNDNFKDHFLSKEFVFENLKRVGLNDLGILNLDINELSGGMQKRVAIARALIKNPEIMFFDEPTSGLDMESSKLIFDLIKDLNAKSSMTFIIITHDVFFAPKIADYIYFLENHKLNRIQKQEVQERFCGEKIN